MISGTQKSTSHEKNEAVVSQKTSRPILQRACACGQHSGGGECDSCKKRRMEVQRAAVNRASPNVAPPIVHEVLRSPGQPLDVGTRGMMESRLGQDFSRVRVHTGARAAQSAQAVNALAYTVGDRITFASGQFHPETPDGQNLLAHELTHVVQQRQMPRSAEHLKVGPADSPLEREAAGAGQARAAGEIGGGARAPGGPLLQRQVHGTGVHQGSAPVNQAARENVPSEKWSEMIEQQYRRRGDTFRAEAVRSCRLQGGAACTRLLTPRDVDRLHRIARESGGNREQIAAGVASLGMLTTVSPGIPTGPPPGLFPPGGIPASPVQPPPIRFPIPPVTTPVPPVAPPVTTPVPPVSPVPAAGAGISAGAVTAVGVTAIVAICVIAGIQLWELGRFQEELRSQGFIILEEALGICIGGCHLPSRPPTSLRDFPRLPELDLPGPRFPFPQQQTRPESETDIYPFPDLDLEPSGRQRRRRPRCIVQEAYPLGGNVEHDALARHVTGQPVEYIVTTTNLAHSARYDGKDAADTLYEIKTRHDFLNLLDQPNQRLRPRGQRVFSDAVPGLIAQLENQALVAAMCGYEFRVATNNLRIVEILRDLAPNIPVEYVQFRLGD